MGCSDGDTECSEDEKPARDVELTRGFWIGQTEVTQAAYQKVKRTNPSQFKGATLPVETVTWDEATAYCGAIGMRLPTEAEWEYAARGGSTAARYGKLEDISWFVTNSYLKNKGSTTNPVALKQPNGFGLYDTLGNVREWVADRYAEDYYASGPARNPRGPATQQYRDYRVTRGGSIVLETNQVRVSHRDGDSLEASRSYLGLRCAGELR